MCVLRRIHTLRVAVFLVWFFLGIPLLVRQLFLHVLCVRKNSFFFHLVYKSVFQSTIRVYECVLEYFFFLLLKVKRIGFWLCIFPSLGRPTKVHSMHGCTTFLTPSSFQFSFVIRFLCCCFFFFWLTIDLRLVTLRMFVFNNLKLDKVFLTVFGFFRYFLFQYLVYMEENIHMVGSHSLSLSLFLTVVSRFQILLEYGIFYTVFLCMRVRVIVIVTFHSYMLFQCCFQFFFDILFSFTFSSISLGYFDVFVYKMTVINYAFEHFLTCIDQYTLHVLCIQHAHTHSVQLKSFNFCVLLSN